MNHNHISTRVDMHFHTQLSDGQKDDDHIFSTAKEKWLDTIVATDHDIINEDFYKQARKRGFNSYYWVEINTKNHTGKQMHVVLYSENFSREIYDILERNREWKINRIIAQIIQMEELWFEITAEGFFSYYRNLWVNISNLNNFHLSEYLLSKKENIIRLKEVFKIDIGQINFIRECLKKGWKYSFIWYVEQDDYLPRLSDLWELFSWTQTILSLAHPNFTFKYTWELRQNIDRFVAEGINAIEVNSLTTKAWVHTVLHAVNDRSLIATFWSDCHFSDKKSWKHWVFWELNHYLDTHILRREIKKLKKALS